MRQSIGQRKIASRGLEARGVITPALVAAFKRLMGQTTINYWENISRFDSGFLHNNVFVYEKDSNSVRRPVAMEVPWPVLITLNLSKKFILLGKRPPEFADVAPAMKDMANRIRWSHKLQDVGNDEGPRLKKL